MNGININSAVLFIKTIVDNSRCVTCDQLNIPRVRYPCGHLTCEDCVLTAEDCLLCLTPPKVSTTYADESSNLHAEHASKLLSSFQELFEIDVYRKLRISEQLKLEKQLFPECIQAPSKYCNKRSSSISVCKENIKPLLFPGEHISNSDAVKMENTFSYVQQWLNKNETILKESKKKLPRKPFADINPNSQSLRKEYTNNRLSEINRNNIYSKKRSFKNHILGCDNVHELQRKRLKEDLDTVTYSTGGKNNILYEKTDKNESGIVLDDETIVINDSQSEYIDKDKLAWLAVIDADKNHSFINTTKYDIDSKTVLDDISKIEKPIQGENTVQITPHKVAFYKKSSILECCSQCNLYYKYSKPIPENYKKPKDVTITIDSNSFVTTIKISQNNENNVKILKQSAQIQTDRDENITIARDVVMCASNEDNGLSKVLKVPELHDKNTSSNLYHNNFNNVKENKNVLETKKKVVHEDKPEIKPKVLIVDDSDSDFDDLFNEKSSTFEVTAEVHQPEISRGIGVLSILNNNDLENRMRHAARGPTPTSTDSSDKENYDPNRAKRQKLIKKFCKK